MQVQCKAVVCPTHFKTQNFCEMLREICPEINTMSGGMIKSSRFDRASVRFHTCSSSIVIMGVRDRKYFIKDYN